MADLKIITPNFNNDPDVFIRMCNSPEQKARRDARLRADQRRHELRETAQNSLWMLAGAAITFVAIMSAAIL